MYLHIGNKKSVRRRDVIGIFDLDSATVTECGKHFVNEMEKKGKTEYADYDLPRSFVLTSEEDGERVRLSRLSSNALAERFEEKINQ